MKSPKKNTLLISLEMEKSKLNREKSVLVLDKALLLYFSFIFIGVIGFINGLIKADILNLLVMMSFGVLIVGIAPYWITMRKEEKRLDELIAAQNKSNGRGGRNV